MKVFQKKKYLKEHEIKKSHPFYARGLLELSCVWWLLRYREKKTLLGYFKQVMNDWLI